MTEGRRYIALKGEIPWNIELYEDEIGLLIKMSTAGMSGMTKKEIESFRRLVRKIQEETDL